MKKATHEDLGRRLSALRADFAALGTRAADAASALAAKLPPPPALLDELSAARGAFTELREAVLEHAGSLALVLDGERLGTLRDLEPVLTAIGAAEIRQAQLHAWEQARESALVVLDHVMALIHREDSNFTALADCQARARTLHGALAGSTPDDLEHETVMISGRLRPFSELLALVDGWNALDDDRCAFLQDAITQSFGRPLGLAALRGKLGREGELPPPEPRARPRGGAAAEPSYPPPGYAPAAYPVPAYPAPATPAGAPVPAAAAASAAATPAGTAPAGAAPAVPAPGAPASGAPAPGAGAPVYPAGGPAYPIGPPVYSAGAPAAPGVAPVPAGGVVVPGAPMAPGVVVTPGTPGMVVTPGAPGVPAGGVVMSGMPVVAGAAGSVVVEIRLSGDKVNVETPQARKERETLLERLAQENAQWWIAARDGWRAMRDRNQSFADASREYLQRFATLLSVPLQKSATADGGNVAEAYALLLAHIEKLEEGFVREALTRLNPQFTTREKDKSYPLGQELYLYVVAEGRLYKTYPDFVKEVVTHALPEAEPWVQGGIVESDAETRLFTRPPALGETAEETKTVTGWKERIGPHVFTVATGPLTTRFVTLRLAGDALADPPDVEIKLKENEAPTDHAWLITLPMPGGKTHAPAAKRHRTGGTTLAGFGKDFGALWIGLFNADPANERHYELAVALRRKPPVEAPKQIKAPAQSPIAGRFFGRKR